MTRAEPTRLYVGGPAPYEVLIGYGLAGELATLLGTDVESVAVVCPRQLRSLGAAIREHLTKAGYRTVPIEIPDGESAKSAEVAAHCWSALGRGGFTRSDAVVGVGGGATTDLAGFVAGTWLRGVRLVNVPTTLLGMVDAAVGGKTGINTADGKNLVGVFHPPVGVLCDLAVLRTLPVAEWVSGLAEVVKAGFIADPEILELIERAPEAATGPEGPHTHELLTRAIRVKADVVATDLKETGGAGSIGREMLNYGHTLGHAIERVERYRWRHGPAVAIGMAFVAELAALQGRIDADLVQRHRKVLGAVGLPVSYRADRWGALRAAMNLDKKARGSKLRLVVLDGLARPVITAAPDEALLTEAYQRIAP
ncbi:MAG TPA: 3-dehydroquinate synthase [Sporichthyaceae bacterium]|jgi:3-dehydroquinate synthase|nr:3-dehydroquinate synthase [Sporichthyaceae bacterium]